MTLKTHTDVDVWVRGWGRADFAAGNEDVELDLAGYAFEGLALAHFEGCGGVVVG